MRRSLNVTSQYAGYPENPCSILSIGSSGSKESSLLVASACKPKNNPLSRQEVTTNTEKIVFYCLANGTKYQFQVSALISSLQSSSRAKGICSVVMAVEKVPRRSEKQDTFLWDVEQSRIIVETMWIYARKVWISC